MKTAFFTYRRRFESPYAMVTVVLNSSPELLTLKISLEKKYNFIMIPLFFMNTQMLDQSPWCSG